MIDKKIEHDVIFTMPAETMMDSTKLADFITQHQALITNRYSILSNAYIGEYPILSYKEKPEYKPDNRIVVNFAKYIVDTFNGFFMGIPVKVYSDDKKVDDYVNLLNKYCDQDDNNAELSKICSIYGKGAELYFNDEEANVQITYMNPMEYFMVYDRSVLMRPLYFVHYYIDDEDEIVGTLYDNINKYDFSSKNDYVISEGIAHRFTDIPATEYIENEERMSIFESVYSMINGNNKALSEKANDVDYFADAYLKVLGSKLDEETMKELRSNRIINFEGDDASEIIVDFLSKPSADETQENLINRLERLIFQISMVANINDENFGSASGIALRYKLQSMSNLVKAKERKFTSGMNRRYKVIFGNPANSMKKDDWVKLQYKFSENYPANLLEESQIASNLSGVTSKETQLKVLSVVEDVQQEMDKINQSYDPLNISTDYSVNR